MRISYDSREWANMYTILYMKADYEPWWKFEGWEAFIQTKETFDTKEQFEQALQRKLNQFRSAYEHEASKEGAIGLFGQKMKAFIVRLVMMMHKYIMA